MPGEEWKETAGGQPSEHGWAAHSRKGEKGGTVAARPATQEASGLTAGMVLWALLR